MQQSDITGYASSASDAGSVIEANEQAVAQTRY